MSEPDSRTILSAAFRRLRGQGFDLGVGELLAAYRALEGGFGTEGPEDLEEIARLLWCHSVEEAAELGEIFRAVLSEQMAAKQPEPSPQQEAPTEKLPATEEATAQTEVVPPQPSPTQTQITPPEPLSGVGATPLPVRAPQRTSMQGETGPELRPYWPLSRRSMVYAWRQFRRVVRDGPLDVPDISATIEKSVRQGFYLAPVYGRRPRNRARLILLVDQGGSMVPFHRFTRDLVESACAGRESRLRRVDVAYFQNVPPAHGYRDPHLTRPIPLEELIVDLDVDTGILVVSDAGAARGHRRPERIRASAEFLAGLKLGTDRLAWLNPMPEERWAGSSAQFIARLVPMFQMDAEGFGRAIAVLRGQQPARRP